MLTKAQKRAMARDAVRARYGYDYVGMTACGDERWFREYPTEDLPDTSIRASTLTRMAELRHEARHYLRAAVGYERKGNAVAADAMRTEAADCIRAATTTHLDNVRRYAPAALPG